MRSSTLGQDERGKHRAAAGGCKRNRDQGVAAADDVAHVDHGVHDHHGGRGGHRHRERQQPAQSRRGQIEPGPPGDVAEHALGPIDRTGGRQADRQHQRCRCHKGRAVDDEESLQAQHQKQSAREGRREQLLQIVGQARERQSSGIDGLLAQDVRYGRLEERRKPGRAGVDDEDQSVNLPDRIDEGQQQHRRGACQVERHEQPAPRQEMRIGPGHRRDEHEGDDP